MEAWEKWWYRAVDSLDAANLLQAQGHSYSAMSRGYYAAYQAATAILLYQKIVPPSLEDREAWSHQATPTLLKTTQTSFWNQNTRNDLSASLSSLYLLRIKADYKVKNDIDGATFVRALKDAALVVRRIGAVLASGNRRPS